MSSLGLKRNSFFKEKWQRTSPRNPSKILDVRTLSRRFSDSNDVSTIIGIIQCLYVWVSRSPSAHAAANDVLMNGLSELHEGSDGVWGVPTLTDELKMKGIKCSVNRVARFMKSNGLQGIPQTRQWKKKDSTQWPRGNPPINSLG